MHDGLGNLTNKKIVITGSTKGLGKALALNFLDKNATVVFNYSRDEYAANEIEKIVSKNSSYKFYCFNADVSDPKQVKMFEKQVYAAIGIPDILINNAGTAESAHLLTMSFQKWKRVIDINLNGVFNCTQIFGRKMIKINRGKIINIGSLTGEMGLGGNCNYSASKAGLIGLTRSSSKDLESFNIQVNAVYPPSIPTELNQRGAESSTLNIKYRNEENSSLSSFINFVTFMCTDDFHTVTGQIFSLNNNE